MIYLNGKYVLENDAKIEHNDRGFLLSDGIFETIRVYDGEISCLSEHYQRLKQSADFLKISFTMSLDEIESVMQGLLARCELNGKNASIRMTLTRGTGPRGLLPPENVKPTLMITAFSFAGHVTKPSNVVISEIKRNETSPLSNIKSLCYLDNIIARINAVNNGADECIMLNTKGNIACASVANIFIVIENRVITPPLADGILPGITRRIIIQLCRDNGIPIYEQNITERDLMKASEVFFTNRLIEIQPVAQINNHRIGNGEIGKVTLLLQNYYKDFIVRNFNQPAHEDGAVKNKKSIKSKL